MIRVDSIFSKNQLPSNMVQMVSSSRALSKGFAGTCIRFSVSPACVLSRQCCSQRYAVRVFQDAGVKTALPVPARLFRAYVHPRSSDQCCFLTQHSAAPPSDSVRQLPGGLFGKDMLYQPEHRGIIFSKQDRFRAEVRLKSKLRFVIRRNRAAASGKFFYVFRQALI